MPDDSFQNRLLDVRPDKLDLRDRLFRPQLRCLPPVYPADEAIDFYLPAYEEAGLILDQGSEGACTGFGLACVINYLYWSRDWRLPLLNGAWDQVDYWPTPPGEGEIAPVSTRMLYHLARFYDEWPGEDYTGSSCRGAMRGWHRHGVCEDRLWPYRDEYNDVAFVEPAEKWQEDAAGRRIGAYYRVATPEFDGRLEAAAKNRPASIDDLQAAIFEVGAVYASASVHRGWMEVPERAPQLPTIEHSDEPAGGHAFAMVGYNKEGFIIQNSWGPKWGYHGFAVMSYRDWVDNGFDAWTAALGAPVEPYTPANYVFSSATRASGSAGSQVGSADQKYVYSNPQVAPWPEGPTGSSYQPLRDAHRFAVVVGNNGVPIKRIADADTAADAVRITAGRNFRLWKEKYNPPKPRVALFLHGGLTDEMNGFQRTRIMGPYFSENRVYPIFVNWKTGILETLWNLGEDAVRGPAGELLPAEGLVRWLSDQVGEAKDRAVEVAAEWAVKPFWTQMKQNARLAARFPRGGFDGPARNAVAALLQQLAAVRDGADGGPEVKELELHVVAHSAGSIMLGEMLPLLEHLRMPVQTCTLWAPACTLEFTLQRYVPAFESPQKILGLSAERFAVELLDDKSERSDSAGPYGKSILYLVSRALEDFHKMPLLGMEREWNPEIRPEQWGDSGKDFVKQWRLFARRKRIKPSLFNSSVPVLHDPSRPATHGGFDNDVTALDRALKRILDGDQFTYDVENLTGF